MGNLSDKSHLPKNVRIYQKEVKIKHIWGHNKKIQLTYEHYHNIVYISYLMSQVWKEIPINIVLSDFKTTD